MFRPAEIPKQIQDKPFLDIVFSYMEACFGQRGIDPPDALFLYRKQNFICELSPDDLCKKDTVFNEIKDDERESIKKILAREASDYCILAHDEEGFIIYYADKQSWNYGEVIDVEGNPAVALFDKVYEGKFLEDIIPKHLHFGPIGDMNPSLD